MKITVTFNIQPGDTTWPEPIEDLLDNLTLTQHEQFAAWVNHALEERSNAESREEGR